MSDDLPELSAELRDLMAQEQTAPGSPPGAQERVRARLVAAIGISAGLGGASAHAPCTTTGTQASAFAGKCYE